MPPMAPPMPVKPDADVAKIRAAYEVAVRMKYLWHEFGDLNLII